MRSELSKFHKRNGAAVMLYHLKPAFVPQLKKELKSLDVGAQVLELDQIFEF